MIEYQLGFIKAQEVWFDAEQQLAEDADLLFYNQIGQRTRHNSQEFHTLVLNLLDDEDVLYQNITKNNRYEINRAQNKDELIHLFFEGKNLTESIVENFVKAYNSFADERSKGTIKVQDFLKYAKNGNLVISIVEKNKAPLVWHTYIVKNGRARLKTSNSVFANEDNETRNLIGRANKWMHWQDALYFKKSGFKVYDFGGWYSGDSDKKLLGINKFKESFGGTIEISYNYTVVKTLKGKLYLLLNQLKSKFKR